MNQTIHLCADSTCDLSPALLERCQVTVLPLHILLDEESYDDGVNLNPDQIYDVYHAKKVLPKTSAVNVAEYEALFREKTADGSAVIYFTISSLMSTCYSNCCLAAEEFPNVYVVDSRNLSTGIGLLVMETYDRITAGQPAKEIFEAISAMTTRVDASFIIDTLEFLYKGGRCSALAMMGANLLKLKPCIEVDPVAGTMGVGKKYRGSFDAALEQYVEDRVAGRTDLIRKRVFITHAGVSDERVETVRRQLESYHLFDEILITRAGCTVSSHCGPNTLGVLFIHE